MNTPVAVRHYPIEAGPGCSLRIDNGSVTTIEARTSIAARRRRHIENVLMPYEHPTLHHTKPMRKIFTNSFRRVVKVFEKRPDVVRV